jgi:chemotaxis protein histidine kinase CheA
MDTWGRTVAMLSSGPAGTTAVLAGGVSEAMTLPLRSFGDRLPKVPGLVGGTVLARGEVAPVLDLNTLLRAQPSARPKP